jgi:hypothetical protein
LRVSLAICAVVVWSCGAGAAELPSRAAKAKPAEEKARSCEIGGEQGFVTQGGGCVRVGGYVSVGVGAGNIRR